MEFPNHNFKQKSFWRRPEGVTGILFLLALLAGLGYVLTALPLKAILANTLALFATIAVVGALVYMVVDPKTRALMAYMYKSAMRAITGVFVTIDPIGILKNYVEELKNKLVKMRTQIGKLRGQMRHLQSLVEGNKREIDQQLKLAAAARDKNMEQQFVLATRKAARLRESNAKYQELLQRMDVLYRILLKMHDNSEILVHDTEDQVRLKEQEHKAIRASHSAMQSAMSVMSGDPDKRAMFEMALEATAEDIAQKVGEMERFMETSADFMDSIDLKNGVFADEGLRMLEQWENQSTLLLMEGTPQIDQLDLQSRATATPDRSVRSAPPEGEGYDSFFK